MPVLRVALQMALSFGMTFALQFLLRAWTPPERRARGWNAATWGAALYAIGPASMIPFSWVLRAPGKRGGASAIARGVTWAAILVAMLTLLDAGFVGRFGTRRERRDAIGVEDEPGVSPRAARRGSERTPVR